MALAWRVCCPWGMENRREHTTIRNRDSPGVREETALRRRRGLGAVSSWLVWFCCQEAVVCWATEAGLDSAGLWFLVLLCSRVSDSLCSETEDQFWSMISEELPSSQGFPIGTRYLLPAGSEKLQLSFFIIIWEPLCQVPAGGHVVMRWGLVAVSVAGTWINKNVLGQITWGQKSEKISLDDSDYTEAIYLCVTFLEHLSISSNLRFTGCMSYVNKDECWSNQTNRKWGS